MQNAAHKNEQDADGTSSHHISNTMTPLRRAKRLVILVIGGSVVLVGLVLVVLPGPATLVLPAGLAILATEFIWARRLLRKVKQGLSDAFRGTRKDRRAS